MALPSDDDVKQEVERRTREILITHVRDVVAQKYKRLLAGAKPSHLGKAAELEQALVLSEAAVSALFDLASKKRK